MNTRLIACLVLTIACVLPGCGAPRDESRNTTAPPFNPQPTAVQLPAPAPSSMPAPSPMAMPETMAKTADANQKFQAEKYSVDQSIGDGSDGFLTMKVYYATDRQAVVYNNVGWGFYFLEFQFTVWAALLTTAAALAALHWNRPTLLKQIFALGTFGTAMLALAAVYTCYQVWCDDTSPGRHYGNHRGKLELGFCEVSIPKEHEVGEVESPCILRLEFSEDRVKHVVFEQATQQSADQFYAALRSSIASSKRNEAFVFVHGFNVTFEEAARRTAQVSYDLKFEGAPIFFSWPSQGGFLDYTVDETNVEWAVPDLKDFLLKVVQQSGAKSVNLIAHSMGNRALTNALRSLASDLRPSVPLFHELVLTAPDIDAEIFKRDIAPVMTQVAHHVTLYASSTDEALLASKTIHGSPRAGDTGTELVVVPGMDTIDVSAVDTGLVGHSYYGSSDSVLADLYWIFATDSPPDKRYWLQPASRDGQTYWVFNCKQPKTAGRSESDPPATR
jgi:esterase/lipase superfamily enzyme